MSPAEDSARDMLAVVWPELRPLLGGGELRPVETDPSRLALAFDRDGGIDWCHVLRERPLRTIASRIQWRHRAGRDAWLGRPWNTFTIRTRTGAGSDWTELTKRLAALAYGGVTPTLVVQAYLERPGGRIESIGLALGDQLYGHIDSWLRDGRTFEPRTNPQDGSEFIAVDWRDLAGWRWFPAMRRRPESPQLDLLGGAA